jgi:hypothetical protein
MPISYTSPALLGRGTAQLSVSEGDAVVGFLVFLHISAAKPVSSDSFRHMIPCPWKCKTSCHWCNL